MLNRRRITESQDWTDVTHKHCIEPTTKLSMAQECTVDAAMSSNKQDKVLDNC